MDVVDNKQSKIADQRCSGYREGWLAKLKLFRAPAYKPIHPKSITIRAHWSNNVKDDGNVFIPFCADSKDNIGDNNGEALKQHRFPRRIIQIFHR